MKKLFNKLDKKLLLLMLIFTIFGLVMVFSASSISAVQDNPVVKAWNKYLQDSSVCTVSTSQK